MVHGNNNRDASPMLKYPVQKPPLHPELPLYQIHNKGIHSSNNDGVTKSRVSLGGKWMKKGYDISQFQRSGEISLYF